MDDYAKCLKQILNLELSRLEIKAEKYKEICDNALDEYMEKEQIINDEIKSVYRIKYRKEIVLVTKIVFLGVVSLLTYVAALYFGSMGLSLIGTPQFITSLFTIFVIGGFIPVWYKIYCKEVCKINDNNQIYDTKIEILKNKLMEYAQELENAEKEYIDVCHRISEVQEEIDNLNNSVVSCEIDGDKQVITVSRKPLAKKRVRR